MDRFRLSGYSDDERWFRVGTVDVTTTVLVTALATFSLFLWAVSRDLVDALVLYSSDVRQGQVWRILTWPLANAPDIWTVLGIALFFMFGREIERLTSRDRFAWMLGILTVVPGAIAVGLNLDHAGIQLIEFVLFGMYVLLYPQARTFFNLPLWVLGAVFLGLQVLQLVGLRDGQQLIFLALLLGTGLLVMRAFGLGDGYPWIPKVPLPSALTGDPYQKANRAREKAQRAQQKGQQRRGENVVPMAPRPPVHLERDAQADMDRLLDKIAASGIDSLTAEERRRLDDHSRRLRGQ